MYPRLIWILESKPAERWRIIPAGWQVTIGNHWPAIVESRLQWPYELDTQVYLKVECRKGNTTKAAAARTVIRTLIVSHYQSSPCSQLIYPSIRRTRNGLKVN